MNGCSTIKQVNRDFLLKKRTFFILYANLQKSTAIELLSSRTVICRQHFECNDLNQHTFVRKLAIAKSNCEVKSL